MGTFCFMTNGLWCFEQAKRKRIAELSVGLTPREHRRKSQWDFVLEEMAWLANDFSQVCQLEHFSFQFCLCSIFNSVPTLILLVLLPDTS